LGACRLGRLWINGKTPGKALFDLLWLALRPRVPSGGHEVKVTALFVEQPNIGDLSTSNDRPGDIESALEDLGFVWLSPTDLTFDELVELSNAFHKSAPGAVFVFDPLLAQARAPGLSNLVSNETKEIQFVVTEIVGSILRAANSNDTVAAARR
jgi:hypothetical protein